MAFVKSYNPLDDQRETTGQTISNNPTISSSSGAVDTSAPQTTTPSDPNKQTGSGSFTNLQRYLSSNQGGAQNLSNKLAGDVTGAVNQANTAMANAGNDFTGQINQSSNIFNPDATQAVNADVNTYKGPSTFAGSSQDQAAQQAIAKAQEKQALAGTVSGRTELLRGILNTNKPASEQTSQGGLNLDQFLVQNTAPAFNTVTSSANKVSPLAGQYAQQSAGLQSQADAARAAALGRLNTAFAPPPPPPAAEPVVATPGPDITGQLGGLIQTGTEQTTPGAVVPTPISETIPGLGENVANTKLPQVRDNTPTGPTAPSEAGPGSSGVGVGTSGDSGTVGSTAAPSATATIGAVAAVAAAVAAPSISTIALAVNAISNAVASSSANAAAAAAADSPAPNASPADAASVASTPSGTPGLSPEGQAAVEGMIGNDAAASAAAANAAADAAADSPAPAASAADAAAAASSPSGTVGDDGSAATGDASSAPSATGDAGSVGTTGASGSTAGDGSDGSDGSDGGVGADGGDGGGGGGGGGGKIICTAMNNLYGLPYNENKVWIKYSKTHMQNEHQVGYHKVFLPLVDFAFKQGDGFFNLQLRKALTWVGRERTQDIKDELAGLNPRPIKRLLIRKTIETALYYIGKWSKK